MARRLALAAVTVFGVATLTFVLTRLAPGDPLANLSERPGVSAEMLDRQRARYGLDRPLPVQYALYLRNLARGDFGESYARHRPVAAVLAEAIPNTLLLGATALVLTFVAGIALGVVQAVRRGSRWDLALGAAALALYSTPSFWLGLMLLLVFGEALGWLPVGGMLDPVMHEGMSPAGKLLDVARHLVLPAATLGLVSAAGVARYQRGAMLEVLREPFVRAARARGLTTRRVVWRHALRSALLPTVTLAGLALPSLLAGAVLVESVFAWPGMGRVAYEAVFQRDYDVVTAVAIVGGAMVALGNLAADLAGAALDPRFRAAG